MHLKKYNEWLEKALDKVLKDELVKIKGDFVEIENKFYKDLEFGTGGLRGIIGVGTSCLNIYTIEKTTKGLANYIAKKAFKNPAVAISYDSRINSSLFAKVAACVLANSNIKVYITKELAPAPFLSYITREHACAMGIMITASHNPKKYNGYKVYGSDGCQVTDIAANEISNEISAVEYFSLKYDTFEKYIENHMINYVADDVIDKYLSDVKSCAINKVENISVTYTPLNGAGYKMVPRVLKEIGVKDLVVVNEQSMPDGNFPTCEYPNPEKKQALSLGLRDAKKNSSDILIATDPDCDRMGIAVLHDKEYKLLSGNEVGVLMCDYLLSQKAASGGIPKDALIVKTIVSTRLADKICSEHGCNIKNVLTGFKYIGEQIGILEKAGHAKSFILGFEESYGYLIGTHVRDKDAVVASMMICEIVSHYKKQGKTLVDVLNWLYSKYGKYQHTLFSYQYEGASGSAKISSIMQALRDKPLDSVGGYAVLSQKDYMQENGDGLPKSNVISYDLQEGSEIIFRPSGTEPLIKIYLTVCKTQEQNDIIIKRITAFLNDYFS